MYTYMFACLFACRYVDIYAYTFALIILPSSSNRDFTHRVIGGLQTASYFGVGGYLNLGLSVYQISSVLLCAESWLQLLHSCSSEGKNNSNRPPSKQKLADQEGASPILVCSVRLGTRHERPQSLPIFWAHIPYSQFQILQNNVNTLLLVTP